MEFALLASGSKGNCCVIRHEDSQIIIDCGSTKRYLTASFAALEIDPLASDALLITHTHQDHISQIRMFRDIATYAAQDVETDHLQHIEAFDTFSCGAFEISVLPMSHDCENTVGYVIACGKEKMVYVTDTGYIKNEVKPYLMNADADIPSGIYQTAYHQ